MAPSLGGCNRNDTQYRPSLPTFLELEFNFFILLMLYPTNPANTLQNLRIDILSRVGLSGDLFFFLRVQGPDKALMELPALF